MVIQLIDSFNFVTVNQFFFLKKIIFFKFELINKSFYRIEKQQQKKQL